MTHKEENIVCIAMKAADLIHANKIDPSQKEGHMGLTVDIIALAEQFEKERAGVDYNAPDAPDYWEDIDLFAEQRLLEEYAIEPKDQENTVSLWARVGVSMDIPHETYEQLMSGDRHALQDVLEGKVGQVRLDGETYFPDIEQNAGLAEMEFDLPVGFGVQNIEQKREPDRTVYLADISIPQREINYLNELLSMEGKDIYEKYGLKRDDTITNTIKFENGYELDMKVVICDEDEAPYVDLVLFNENGCEVACDTGEDMSEGSISFEVGNAIYIGIIKMEPEIEMPKQFVPDDPVKVFASSGGVKQQIYSGDWDECTKFCEEHGWSFLDENEFEWDLEMEDAREDAFPEGFYNALAYYHRVTGGEIDSEFVRQHANELVYCHQNGKDLLDFDFWAKYETLLNEPLSYDEYVKLDKTYGGDPLEIDEKNDIVISSLKSSLLDLRCSSEKETPRLSLNDQIQSAQNRKTQQPISAKENEHDR